MLRDPKRESGDVGCVALWSRCRDAGRVARMEVKCCTLFSSSLRLSNELLPMFHEPGKIVDQCLPCFLLSTFHDSFLGT